MEKVMKANSFQELNEVEVMETEGGATAVNSGIVQMIVKISEMVSSKKTPPTPADFAAHSQCGVNNCIVTSWEDCCPYNQ